MVTSRDQRVRVYTTEGYLKSTINVPEVYRVYEAAYHYGIGKIIAWAGYDGKKSYNVTLKQVHWSILWI